MVEHQADPDQLPDQSIVLINCIMTYIIFPMKIQMLVVF